jgi:hypothetical protein
MNPEFRKAEAELDESGLLDGVTGKIPNKSAARDALSAGVLDS